MQPRKAPEPVRPHSIGAHLGLLTGILVALAVLVASLSGIMVLRLVDQRAEESARQLARTAALMLDRFVQDAEGSLRVVAARAHPAGEDGAACARRLTGHRELTTEFYALAETDDRGRVRCASEDAGAGRLPPGSVPGERLRDARGPVVGPPLRLGEEGRWISHVFHPVRGPDGAYRGAVVGMVALDRFQRLLDQIPLPEDGIVTVVDVSTATIVARTEDPERWVGRRLPAEGLSPDEVRRGGVIRVTGPDGVDRVWGYEPVPRADWAVNTGFPVSWIREPARNTALGSALLALTLLILAVVLADRLRRSIVEPIRAMVDESRAAVRGRARSIEVRGPDELRELASAFNRTLRDRETLDERLRHTEKIEAVSRLAGGVAHEFRNILTVITGETSLARSQAGEGTELAESLRNVHEAAVRAARLTDKLLAISEQDPEELEPTDLSRAVAEEVRLLSVGLDAPHAIEVDLERDLPPVLCGRRRLDAILRELVTNAVDATPGGGTVRVRTRSPTGRDPGRGPGEKEPAGTGRQDGAVLEVEDEGEGMEPSVRRRIFEPFYTTRPRSRAMGLGLSTVRGLVRQVGGRIEVESEAGEGTRVRIFFPAAAEHRTS